MKATTIIIAAPAAATYPLNNNIIVKDDFYWSFLYFLPLVVGEFFFVKVVCFVEVTIQVYFRNLSASAIKCAAYRARARSITRLSGTLSYLEQRPNWRNIF